MNCFVLMGLMQPLVLHVAAQAETLLFSDGSILLCSSILGVYQIDTPCHSSVKSSIFDATVEQILCQNRIEQIDTCWHVAKYA